MSMLGRQWNSFDGCFWRIGCRGSRRPTITVWRKLRRLGVVQIVDGLVALPLDPVFGEQLEWIADEVIEAGGESSLWIAEAASAIWNANSPHRWLRRLRASTPQ